MLYNLVLEKNNPHVNAKMASVPAEVQKSWDQVFSQETFARYGAKWIVYCDSTWCSEEYPLFAINTYTDIPARIAHMQEIEKASWLQYADILLF